MVAAAHALRTIGKNDKNPGVAFVATKPRLVCSYIMLRTPAMSVTLWAFDPGIVDRNYTNPLMFTSNANHLTRQVWLIRPNVYNFAHAYI